MAKESSTDLTMDSPGILPEDQRVNSIAVGSLVEVASRTWPGMNKQGGIARVVALSDGAVDVHYIVDHGRKEKKVSLDYVRIAPIANQFEPANARRNRKLRDRSMLLGRCKRCGSLRADCGSCDWMMEEEANDIGENSIALQTTTTSVSDTSLQEEAMETLQEASDEDDDVELEQLMSRNRERYRRYKQICANYRQRFMLSSSDEDQPRSTRTSRNRQTRRLANQVHSLPSSSDDESFQATLRNLPSYQPLPSSRIKAGHSTAHRPESLHQRRAVTALSQRSSKKSQSSGFPADSSSSDKTSAAKLVDQPEFPSGLTSSNPVPSRSHRLNIFSSNAPDRAYPNEDDDGMAGIVDAEASSTSDVSANDSASDSPPQQSLTASVEMAQQVHNSGYSQIPQELVDFIQPEGETVAKNLPQDILDRTLKLEFKHLPHFFDNWATRIENELLPDAKLRVAHLEKRFQQQHGHLQELTNESQSVFQELRRDLVRDGIDQCRAALHRLLDGREYRKHRKTMTAAERKECRRIDPRDLKMDQLDAEAEACLQKVKTIVAALKGTSDDLKEEEEQWDDSTDQSDTPCYESDASEQSKQIKATIEEKVDRLDYHTTNHPSELLPPFDPHMRARRVRTPGQQQDYIGASTKRNMGAVNRRNTTETRRKPLLSVQSMSVVAGESSTTRRSKHKNRSLRRNANTENQNKRSGLVSSMDSHKRRRIGSCKQRKQDRIVHYNSNEGCSTTIDEASKETQGFNDALGEFVPALDDLLRDDSKRVRRSSNSIQMENRAISRIPIADRMEAFLAANSGTAYEDNTARMEFFQPEANENKSKGEKRRDRLQREHRSRRNRNSISGAERRSNANDRTTHVSSASKRQSSRDHSIDRNHSAPDPQALADLLYEHILPEAAVSATRLSAPDYNDNILYQDEAPMHSLSNLCHQLDDGYLDSASGFVERMRKMNKCFVQMKDKEYSSTDSVRFFTSALNLLKTRGCCTLQSYLSQENPLMLHHVALLETIIIALDLGFNDRLVAQDGLIFELFAPNNQHRFVNFVLDQLVDSVYSLIHQQGWALSLRSGNASSVLERLTPLRRALGKQRNLLEAISTCLTQRLATQQWRMIGGSHPFVSSIDPEMWRTFLQTGKVPERGVDLRLLHFKSRLPSGEIDAIWSLLAFFAGSSRASADHKSSVCWQLISRLFSFSVLSEAVPSEAELAPSRGQILSCERYLTYLNSLLVSGGIDSLPGKDVMLITLLRKAVELQADDYFLNEESRFAVHPVVGESKESKTAMRELWTRTGLRLKHSDKAVRVYRLTADEFFCSFGTLKHMHVRSGQPTILPSSLILRRCLGLLVLWSRLVPGKKARVSRFVGAINSFVNDLVSKACLLESNVKSNNEGLARGSFIATFASTYNRSGTAAERKSVFCRESGAYLLICRALASRFTGETSTMPCPTLLNMSQKVWNLLACDILKQRRDQIAVRLTSPSTAYTKYEKSGYRLYTIAKTLTFLALASFGIPGWNTARLERDTISGGLWFDDKPGEEALTFITSCLIACLDCLCDIACSTDVFPSLCWNITVLHVHACNIVAHNQSHHLKELDPAIHAMGVSSLRMMAETCKKCLLFVTSISDPKVDISFQSLLIALRAVLILNLHTIKPTSPAAEQNSQSHENNHTESDGDFFGGLDDKLFECIPLEPFGNEAASRGLQQRAENEVTAESLICKLIVDMIRSSKPSKRFEIETANNYTDHVEENFIGATGRSIIARNHLYVCRCLTFLYPLCRGNWQLGRALKELIHFPSLLSADSDDPDGDYAKSLSQCLSTNMCGLFRAFPRYCDLLCMHFESILCSLVGAMVDSSYLDKFPSCNLGRMKEAGGKFAEEKELGRLLASNSSLTADATLFDRKPWDFCLNFGYALTIPPTATQGDQFAVRKRLGEILQNECRPKTLSGATWLISLETEYLRRFRILCSIICLYGRSASTPSSESFERLCSCILSCASNELLRLNKRLCLYDLACESENRGSAYQKARNIELLRSYADLHSSTIALILRECHYCHTKSFQELLRYIRDSHLCHVLHGRKNKLANTLHGIVALANSTLRKEYRQAPSETEVYDQSDFKYLDIYEPVSRRCREFLVHVCICRLAEQGDNGSRLFGAILAAGCGKANNCNPDDTSIPRIGRSFSSKATSSSNTNHGDSELAVGIDKWIRDNEVSAPLGSREMSVLQELKHDAITNFILPRLNHLKTPADARKGLVGFMCSLMLEYDYPNDHVQRKKMEASTLAALARGLSTSLRMSLGAENVDDELLQQTFSCSKRFLNLKLSLFEIDEEQVGLDQTLLEWCSPAARRSSLLDNVEGSEVYRSYLSCWCVWLNQVAEIATDQTDSGSGRLLDLRQDLWSHIEKQRKSNWVWSTQIEGFTSSASELERMLFGDKENDPRIVNVYSKTNPSRANGEKPSLSSWNPSVRTRRFIKEFLTELIPYS